MRAFAQQPAAVITATKLADNFTLFSGAGCNVRGEIGSIGRRSYFLKDDVKPRVASKCDGYVLGIPHRHQLLFTRESDVRGDPFPQPGIPEGVPALPLVVVCGQDPFEAAEGATPIDGVG